MLGLKPGDVVALEPRIEAGKKIWVLRPLSTRPSCGSGGSRGLLCLAAHYGVSKKNALVGLRRRFADGEIKPLGVAAEVLAVTGIASEKPGFVDRLIHGAYGAAADEMVTFEKAADKLKSIRGL